MITVTIHYRGQTGSCEINVHPATDLRIIKYLCEKAVRAGRVAGISAAVARGAFANLFLQSEDQARFTLRAPSQSYVNASDYWLVK